MIRLIQTNWLMRHSHSHTWHTSIVIHATVIHGLVHWIMNSLRCHFIVGDRLIETINEITTNNIAGIATSIILSLIATWKHFTVHIMLSFYECWLLGFRIVTLVGHLRCFGSTHGGYRLFTSSHGTLLSLTNCCKWLNLLWYSIAFKQIGCWVSTIIVLLRLVYTSWQFTS